MAEGRALVETGCRENSHILHRQDGFHYHVREVRGPIVRLRCRHYNRGCRGTALVNLDDANMLLQHLAAHNHGPDMLLFQDMEMRRALIQEAAVSFSGRTPTQILTDAKYNCRNIELSSRFTTARMRRALDAARMRNYPLIPRTLLHLGITLGSPNMRAVSATRDGTDILFRGVVGYLHNQTVSVVFISGRMLQFLQSRVSIHADGTFKKRPRKPRCSQIFNITTSHGNTVICIMRVLMQRRTFEAYDALFRFIRQIAPHFRPARIHSDFEQAQVKAWLHNYPYAILVGCLWHYGVDVSAYARFLGLAQIAKDNDVVMCYIRCLSAIPLLPTDRICNAVWLLWMDACECPWAELLHPMFEYWIRVWFPRLEVLSVFGQPERTNNVAESDNKMMANVFPANHPNGWRCVSGFVLLEHLAWGDKLASDRGQLVTGPRRYATVATDRIVQRLSNLLLNEDINILQFLHRASWRLMTAVMHGLRLNRDVDSSSSSESDSE